MEVALDATAHSGHPGAMLIYKILRAGEWAALRTDGETRGAPVDIADGFIHFSTAAQVAETAARHFAGARDLELLAYDSETLGPALKWEPSRDGALFPHLYGPLRLSDMLWHSPLPPENGRHVLPEGVI